MCGITAVFERQGGEVDARRLAEMRDAMTHRGPDGEGLWMRELRDVGLAHRRLSIVDLSEAGRQPMSNEDGSVQVTFNGEIYNHDELRADLEKRGHRFRSRCDTEVLVHLYEEHGTRMVDHLVGMFAFAIWDESRERVVVARDRLGIKPLYWLDQGGRFACASEIKALLPLLGRRDLDPEALANYLTFVAVPPPLTLIEGVFKLPPGSTMVISRSGPSEPERFWDPLANRVRLDADQADWDGEFRQRLERSIERRMMSDVPVGVFLSGGVDSSTNVALMSRLVDEPVNTFSIGFRDEPHFNEFHWARQVAERFGTRHHETEIDAGDLWNVLPSLVHHQDEPIADPVCVPLYYVSRLAKDSGVTVVHVGEGADELLAGYPTYATALRMTEGPWRRLRSLPGPVRGLIGAAGGRALERLPEREIHGEALRRAAEEDARLWWGGAVAFYERGLERLTTQSFRDQLNGDRPRDVVARINADATAAGARDELDRLIYQDLRLRLPELLLMRVDKLTMASSVEARVPFLDHELVEFAMTLPRDEKISRDGTGKAILKRVMADLLPQELLHRPKQGFGAPVASWFRGELSGRVRDALRNSELAGLGVLEPSRVDEIVDLHASGRADRSFQLWNLLNLSVWFDHWIAGKPAPESAGV
jgi:asparagine synthase (glutamine-hydrolysing)